MMRVLVLCEYPSLNGGEHSLLEAVRSAGRPDIEWRFAAPPAGPLADLLCRRGWIHEPLELVDPQGQRLNRDLVHARLAAVIARHAPQVVHANSVAMARLSGPVVQRIGAASVGHLRDIVRLSAAALADLQRHQRLLAVSAATRGWYHACGIPGDRLHVAYNGVDLVRFAPRPAVGYVHAQLGLEPTARLVGTIGQIGPRKGTDLFLTAAAWVARSMPDVHYLIVGQRYSRKAESRQFEADVRERAEREPLQGRVHFLGVRADIDRLLNELTVYVHAARQEPLGRVLLEAAAAGLPIVATSVGGTREIFPDAARAVLLVPPADVPRLAQSLADALNSRMLRHELGQAARRRAQAAFDIQSAAAQLVGHYAAVHPDAL